MGGRAQGTRNEGEVRKRNNAAARDVSRATALFSHTTADFSVRSLGDPASESKSLREDETLGEKIVILLKFVEEFFAEF